MPRRAPEHSEPHAFETAPTLDESEKPAKRTRRKKSDTTVDLAAMNSSDWMTLLGPILVQFVESLLPTIEDTIRAILSDLLGGSSRDELVNKETGELVDVSNIQTQLQSVSEWVSNVVSELNTKVQSMAELPENNFSRISALEQRINQLETTVDSAMQKVEEALKRAAQADATQPVAQPAAQPVVNPAQAALQAGVQRAAHRVEPVAGIQGTRGPAITTQQQPAAASQAPVPAAQRSPIPQGNPFQTKPQGAPQGAPGGMPFPVRR